MPDSSTLYLIDTSVLVNIRDEHDDSIEIWERLIDLIEEGRLKTVKHVMDELKSKFPDIHKRLKPYKKAFEVSAVALYGEETIAEVREVRIHHPKLFDGEGTGNPADPWLVGCAKTLNAVVVTDERRKGKKHTEKIPFVCKARNVGCADRGEFFHAVGIDPDSPNRGK